MRSPLLTTEQLTVGYPASARTNPVASHLQLSMLPGQLVCLLGPNGSGKSTLLRTLAGMQSPLSGYVQVGAQRLDHLQAQQRAQRLAVVLTEPILAQFTVYDLVAMGRYPYTGWLGQLSTNDRQSVENALSVTQTLEFADRLVSTLSDGERQKVAIARAVAQDTPLMILDEPTAHLDVPNRTRVLQLLQALAHQHQKAILLSTHALDLALLLADRLWLMNDGNIRCGTPEDLVLNGALPNVFGREGLAFDLDTGTFRLNRPEGRSVGLAGPMPQVFWTRRALERVGYSVVSASAAVPSVYALAGHPSRWAIEHAGNRVESDNIAAVLEQLRQLLK